jgi:hypothetical protein
MLAWLCEMLVRIFQITMEADWSVRRETKS